MTPNIDGQKGPCWSQETPGMELWGSFCRGNAVCCSTLAQKTHELRGFICFARGPHREVCNPGGTSTVKKRRSAGFWRFASHETNPRKGFRSSHFVLWFLTLDSWARVPKIKRHDPILGSEGDSRFPALFAAVLNMALLRPPEVQATRTLWTSE